jgi:hypothetical protein
VAAAFASGRHVSRRLPAAVARTGIGLALHGGLCSFAGRGTPLAVVVLRPGTGRGSARLGVILPRPDFGRGLARLAVLVPRPGPGRGFARLGGIDPTHAVGWGPAGVDGHGAWLPEKQGDGEEECFGGTCGEGHCGKQQGASAGRAHGNLHYAWTDSRLR